jgi:hypothetical protein
VNMLVKDERLDGWIRAIDSGGSGPCLLRKRVSAEACIPTG